MSARYSQEFKLKALTMLDQGATISDVRTGLGADSPDRSTVFRWYQQQQETGQHRAASHRRGKASANTIGLVVANILVRNATPRDTAAAYDVHAESARQWSRRYQPDPDTVDITDFTAVAEATMVLVTNSRKKHKSAPIKRRAATKVTQTPIVPNLPPIDDNGSIEPGRSAASPKATGGDQPASTRTPTSPGTASPALTPEGLPDDPDVLKQMLIDERIHRAVAEAKVVLLGKDGVPASNRDATDLIDLPHVSSVSARSSFMESSGSRNQPTFA